MDDNRKSFTFIWKIKNFIFSFNSTMIASPAFVVHAMCQTNWILVLGIQNTQVFCMLKRLHSGPYEIELDHEFSFLAADGSVIDSKIFLNRVFLKNSFHVSSALILKKDEVFVHKKNLYLPNDTLTVRCRMWKSQRSILESARCSVETQINIERGSFVGTIEKFSSLKKSNKNGVCVKSTKFHLSSINLCINDDEKLEIDINFDYVHDTLYKFKVFILDVHGNKVKSCQEDIYDSPLCIPFTFSREHLIKNREYYIPNDVLTLHFEVFFTSLPKYISDVDVINILYENDIQEDIQAVISNATNTNPSSVEHHTESLTTIRDDFISLYREGFLSDTKLKTATEIFPAHTAVLSARSPVFKSIFETDMREKTNHCVDIDDLNADTVQQMLLFMYSDTLDDLDYERAKNLYFAADKYSIVSLRHRCSSFLKQNLLHSNCCDVLLLADRHQDKDLKRYVQDCIAENDEAVFSSDEWKDLEERHPRLTTETFRAVYMKNRRS